MMTKQGDTMISKLAKCLGNNVPDNCVRPERNYPLYWLSPNKDLGVRRLRLSSLCPEPGNSSADGSNLVHYPKYSGFVKYLLFRIGLEGSEQKKPAIKVVKIDGKYFVEQGHQLLQLARALKLEFITVHVVEYYFELLKRKMRVLKYPDLQLVAISTSQKGNYSYQGVSPENVDVLLKQHKIPLVDYTILATEACSGGAAIAMRQEGKAAPNYKANKKRSHLTRVK